MKRMRFFGIFLAVCLCLMVASMAYSVKPDKPPKPDPEPDPEPATYITYHGYAKLENGHDIASDGQGPYVDRDLVSVKGNPHNKRGDKIVVQLKYDPDNNKYDLRWFRCFMGKPELPWRSPRRVNFNNVVISDTNKGDGYDTNSTVADMLRYTVQGFATQEPRDLDDGSVHLSVAKGWWDAEAEIYYDSVCWATCLVDKSCEGEEVDPDAITQPNLWSLNYEAPRYWTSLEGSSFGSEEDPHGHIGFFIFEGQLDFNSIGHEPQETAQGTVYIPVTWEVIPKASYSAINVRRLIDNPDPNAYPNDVLDPPAPFEGPATQIWKNIGLSFRLIVSKYEDFREDSSLAPPRHNTLSATWGNIKVE